MVLLFASLFSESCAPCPSTYEVVGSEPLNLRLTGFIAHLLQRNTRLSFHFQGPELHARDILWLLCFLLDSPIFVSLTNVFTLSPFSSTGWNKFQTALIHLSRFIPHFPVTTYTTLYLAETMHMTQNVTGSPYFRLYTDCLLPLGLLRWNAGPIQNKTIRVPRVLTSHTHTQEDH